jgi:hypothetical protein
VAHETLQAPAPSLPLTPGMVLKLESLDPDADAAITGVTCTQWAIYGYDLSPAPEQTGGLKPLLLPRSGR